MDLSTILSECQSPDNSVRQQAEAKLKQAEENHAAQLYSLLAAEISNSSRPAPVRQLAALKLKNAFWGRTRASDQKARQAWLGLPAEARGQIKEHVVGTLSAQGEVVARKAAAQVVSAICRIELPQGQWDDVLSHLSQMSEDTNPENRGVAQLAMGYICEDATGMMQRDGTELPQGASAILLRSVVRGMGESESEMSVRTAATKAFYWAIPLAESSMIDKNQRDVLMEAIAVNCKYKGSDEIRSAAYECLVQMAAEFYEYLFPYMSVLGPMSWDAIRDGKESLAIAALEFWSTIADYELSCIQDPNSPPADATVSGEPDADGVFHIIRKALHYLVPLLTECLTKHDNDPDDPDYDSWNVSMAAGTCLGLVAQVVGDGCLELVLQFVNQNFTSENWASREAALMAYGSVMDGPSSTKLSPLVQNSFVHIVKALSDDKVAVRDTCAWTLGRIAQFHPAIMNSYVAQLVPMLTSRLLQDRLHVSSHIAWLFHTLGENLKPKGSHSSLSPPTTVLSAHFTSILDAVLKAAVRPGEGGGSSTNFRATCYLAVGALVKYCGSDCKIHLQAVFQELCKHLEASLQVERLQAQIQGVGGEPSDSELELQAQICGALQMVCYRLRPGTDSGQSSDQDNLNILASVAQQMWGLLMRLFEVYKEIQIKTRSSEDEDVSLMHEGGLLAANALVVSLGSHMHPFAADYVRVLELAICGDPSYPPKGQQAEGQREKVLKLAAGCVGDLSRALDSDMPLELTDRLMTILVQKLKDPSTSQQTKPAIIVAFGDVALAVKGGFKKYLGEVLETLKYAALVRLADGPIEDEAWLDLVFEIRLAVFDAYTGVVWGLKDGNELAALQSNVEDMLRFCDLAASQQERTVPEDILPADFLMEEQMAPVDSACLGLLGDLLTVYGADLSRVLQGGGSAYAAVTQLITQANSSKDQEIRRRAKWVKSQIQKHLNMGS